MTEFLTAITAFPTLLFTIPVGLSVLYWLFVVIGAIDIDILNFDGVEGVFEGGLDGALDGVLDGGFDAALDGALDAGLDGALDAGLDGVADGATDAA